MSNPALLPLLVLAIVVPVMEVRRSHWWHDHAHRKREGFLCNHCLAVERAARGARYAAMYKAHDQRMEEIYRLYPHNARKET